MDRCVVEEERLIWKKGKGRNPEEEGGKAWGEREGKSDEAVVKWRDRMKWSGKDIKEK